MECLWHLLVLASIWCSSAAIAPREGMMAPLLEPRTPTKQKASKAKRWRHNCQATLQRLGLWKHYNWKFVQPAVGRPVVWLHGNPSCYKKVDGRCLPLFEWDWVFAVTLRWVAGINRTQTIADGHFHTLAQGGIYVHHDTGATTPPSFVRLAKALQACNASATLLHLSDETGSRTPTYKEWPLILRQYWNQSTVTRWGEKVIVVPLGTAALYWRYDDEHMRGHPEQIPGLSNRNNTWAFYGDMQKTTRHTMGAAMQTVPGGFIYKSHGFAGQDMVLPYRVRRTLLKSLFCPAPTGWSSVDTFRFSEALEAGCTPIVDAGIPGIVRRFFDNEEFITDAAKPNLGYFAEYFGHYDPGGPAMQYILQVNNPLEWSQVPQRISNLMSDGAAFQARQKAMVMWWSGFKRRMGRLVAERIEST